MLFYRAALPLSRKTLNYAAGIIRRHRKAIGSRWRKLNPGQQALLVLAYLRKGETFADLAAGFAVGTTTAWRYVEEVVALLAARAPKLRQAVRDARKAGWAYVVLDGTLIPIDRVAADRPFYSGKHKKHGMNLQVIATPDGDIVWVSGSLPGSVHDKTAEWIWGVLAELEAPMSYQFDCQHGEDGEPDCRCDGCTACRNALTAVAYIDEVMTRSRSRK